MPTYEYRCRDCGRDFEVFQKMSDRPGVPCPECARPAERLISGGAGFLFRGDGFYITDHRSEDYRRKAREEAGGVGGKAEDKPDKGAAKTSSGEAVSSDGKRAGPARREGQKESASRTPAGTGNRDGRGDTASAGSTQTTGRDGPGGEGR